MKDTIEIEDLQEGLFYNVNRLKMILSEKFINEHDVETIRGEYDECYTMIHYYAYHLLKAGKNVTLHYSEELYSCLKFGTVANMQQITVS